MTILYVVAAFVAIVLVGKVFRLVKNLLILGVLASLLFFFLV